MESINSVIQPSSRTQGESGSRSDQTNTATESAGPAEPTIQKTDELRLLKEEIQALKNYIHVLKTENQLLKSKLKAADCATLADHDLHKKMHVPCLYESPLDSCQSFAPNLPPEILSMIFKNLTETSSLLACRAVCTSWKTLIDNTPAYMRRFTFLIMHPSLFLDLTNIAPHVRSIKFKSMLPSTEEELQDLVRAIAPTLESVAFEFDMDGNSAIIKQQQDRIMSLVLRQCPKLNELRILSNQVDFIPFTHTEPMFNNLTSLTVRALHLDKQLILSLARLSNLVLVSPTYEITKTVNTYLTTIAVRQHILKYPGVLKKFAYIAGDHRWFGHLDASWTKMFLLAGMHDVAVSTDRPLDLINLSHDSHEYPVNLKSCSAINNILLRCSPNASFERADLCLNVQKIEVKNQLGDVINQRTLDILCQLTKLHKLSLDGFPVSQPFAAFFTTLHVYFPNLMDLRLCRISVRENLFVSLSRLGRLTILELKCLTGLTDAVFLHPQANNSGIPAIASLTKLKELTLWECRYVTNNCLTNGILLSQTLEKLTLLGDCKSFKAIGYATIRNGRLKKMRVIRQGEDGGLSFTLT